MEFDSFCNPVQPPSHLILPSNFNWVFLKGIWTLVPAKFAKDFSYDPFIKEENFHGENPKFWEEENQTDVSLPNTGTLGIEGSGLEEDSQDIHRIEYFESNFEEKVRRLLLFGQMEESTLGTRKIEWKKKPSLRWNEEVGFIPQPPRSVKKKGASSTTPEGTSSNLFLIND